MEVSDCSDLFNLVKGWQLGQQGWEIDGLESLKGLFASGGKRVVVDLRVAFMNGYFPDLLNLELPLEE